MVSRLSSIAPEEQSKTLAACTLGRHHANSPPTPTRCLQTWAWHLSRPFCSQLHEDGEQRPHFILNTRMDPSLVTQKKEMQVDSVSSVQITICNADFHMIKLHFSPEIQYCPFSTSEASVTDFIFYPLRNMLYK